MAQDLRPAYNRLGLSVIVAGGRDDSQETAEALIPIIQSLGKELQPLGKDPRLAEVKHALTLVHGTLLNALPKILQAIALKEEKGMRVFSDACSVCQAPRGGEKNEVLK